MSQKKKKKTGPAQDSGLMHKRYYDPGARPYAPAPVHVTRDVVGPTANTRQGRRARARLPFIEQRALAQKMGFSVPPELQLTAATGAAFWIQTWEDLYAAQP
jgi:hypothetical protein